MRVLLRLITVTAIAVLFVSCEMVQELLGTSSDDNSGSGGNGGSEEPPHDPTFTSSVYRLEGVFEGVTDIDVDLGSSGRDLYYVYTNTSGNDFVAGAGSTANTAVLWGPADRILLASHYLSASSLSTDRFEPRRRGLPPGLSHYLPGASGTDAAVGAASVAPLTADSYALGDTETLHTGVGTATAEYPDVDATVRGLSDDGTREVYIWVDDDYYVTAGLGDTAYQALAEEFLLPGSENDIFDWITAIFGDPWGSHDYVDLIPLGSEDIHVLLFDITTDNIAGYFWSKDNFLASVYPGSNERLMFYIDLPFFAEEDPDDSDTVWEITDAGPADMVATLAHEFQHMINYYERDVLLNPNNYLIDSWINEMASMVAEDLVADKLEIAGPRGVDPTDGSGGEGVSGRLWTYITSAAAYPLTEFGDDLAANYSNYYSFGAYLSRTYGSELFTEIARQPVEQTDAAGNGEVALLAAIETVTGETSPDFDELIRRWAVAMFVSDDTSVASPYQINSGTWFESETNGLSFNLGSIDLYEHYNSFSGGGTPFFYWGPLIHEYETSQITVADEANAFFIRVQNGTGTVIDAVDLPEGVTLTVLSRTAQ